MKKKNLCKSMEKWLVIFFIIQTVILCMVGCDKTENLNSYTDSISENTESPQPSVTKLSVERAESFVLTYDRKKTNLVISLKDCICEYDHDRVQIYSKCVDDYEWTGSKAAFPQYVLYIQTPYETTQIFPVKDFFINQEREILYILEEEFSFKSIQIIDDFRRKKGSVIQSERIILDKDQLKEMMEKAHNISDSDTILSDLSFDFIALEQENEKDILKGEASGIKPSTEEKYYIDFEWDEALNEGTASPYIPRIYDEVKDKSAFTKCKAAYDRIEQGDLSMVTVHHRVKSKSLWEAYNTQGLASLEIEEDASWRREDINKDGMPELIRQDGNGDRTEHKKPIDLIFTYHDDQVELVYADFADAMEFLYLSDNGTLMYENTVLGDPQSSEFTKYYFDEKWHLTFEESLELLYFHNEDENEDEYLYYLYNQSGYHLSCREFLDTYKSMTGQEFWGDHTFYWELPFEEAMTDERFYEYEIRKDDTGNPYAVITGIAEPYKEDVKANLRRLNPSWWLTFPETLEDVTVREIAPYAFQNTDLGYEYLQLPSGLAVIGEHCFENCGLYDVIFERKTDRRKLVIGDRAFADNENLFGVYLNTANTFLGEEVFAGCAKKLYLCYNSESEETDKKLTEYAQGNNLEAVEIPLSFTEEPIVNYPETPLVLTPEIRNFFYGESADDEKFCSFEYDDNAPDFGFPEWQLPCGESDAMIWSLDITATSELASLEEGKYDARNMMYSDRKYAWAEGVEGYGIGESISITESCGDGREWRGGDVYFYEGDIEPDVLDGYIRYTEICIVNGYAKNQKTWEENGRVKRLLMYVEDQPYAYLDLEDTIYPQYFKLPINDIKAADCVDVHFKFVIEDVYPGTKYEDTCLTGLQVEFIGRHSH